MKIKIAIIALIIVSCFCQGYANIIKQAGGNPAGLYKFMGKLNDKIPVFMWFVVKDNVLKGEVTYLKTSKRMPITIIGTVDATNRLDINEFSKTGNITGFYNGKFDEHSFSGVWQAPGSDKELKFNLTKKDTVIANINTDLTPTNITGKYSYEFAKLGAAGGIDIQQTKPGYYTFRINCVTASPANNIADTQGVKVKMVNNTITYKLADEDCEFTIKAYNGFIVIDYVHDHYNCGFGLSATVNGIFIKTSDKAKVELL